MSKPTKSIPNPVRVFPIILGFSFLAINVMKAPNPVNEAKIVVAEIPAPPNNPRATICAVIVVPILAPYITVAACCRDIIPTLTNPMIITVVAPDDWIAAVPSAPIPTPNILLSETRAKRVLSRELPAASKFVDIKRQATKKMPIPANNVKTAIKLSKNPILSKIILSIHKIQKQNIFTYHTWT